MDDKKMQDNKKYILIFASICVAAIIVFLVVFFIGSRSNSDEPTPFETPQTEVAQEYDFKGEYLEGYKELEVPEVRKFLGTAIVNVRPYEYRNFDIPVISENDTNANLMFNLAHLDSFWLEDYAISVSQSNTRAYTVYIVKPKEEYYQQVASAVQQRIEDLKRTLINYPDQLYLVDTAVVEQVGDFLAVVICDNAQEVYNELFKVMDSLDLANLNEVPLMTEEERTEIENKALDEEIKAMYDEIEDVVVTPVEDTSISMPAPTVVPDVSN